MILFFLLAGLIITVCCVYNYQLTPIDKNDDTKIEIVIPSGSSVKNIGDILEKNELIRSSNFFFLYCRIYKVNDMKATTYQLSKDMPIEEIVDVLRKGNSYNPDEITITFQEGINMRKVASIIASNTNNKYDDVLALLKDETYINELINEYWFITEDIKNPNIYYSLEGYLFPNTYKFLNKDVSIKEIFKKMFDSMENVLNEYKTEIENSKYSVHEILTLSSVIEKEGKTKDFKKISSTFHNRLNINMKLESCATTYYGMGLDFNEVGIATNEMTSNLNPYNTYQISGLPVGPIALPSKNAIEAAVRPETSNYLFFLSDNQGVTYFFNTYSEHQQKETELRQQGKWDR